MKKPNAREMAKQETREALIKAAMELFNEVGLDVSLDAVCARAGYTRGAFYVHFKDRDALTSAVMARIGDRVLDTLLGDIGDIGENDNLITIVQRFLGALFSGDYPLTQHGGVRPYQLLDACARSPEIRDQYVRLVQDGISRLAKRLGEGQQQGLVRHDLAAEPTAAMLIALAIGIHTMFDLVMPIDLTGGSTALLQMLMPPPPA